MAAPTATKWLFISWPRLHKARIYKHSGEWGYLPYGDKLFHLGFENSKYFKKYPNAILAVTEICKTKA